MTYMFQSKIPCIGHLSAEEIIDAAGLNFEDFQGKKVLDLGCGISNLLSQIGNSTNPQRLVGVDPMFKKPETIQAGIRSTRQHIDDLLLTPGLQNSTRQLLKERSRVIAKFKLQGSKVDYYPHVSHLGREKFDYIFVSFVFRHLSDMLTRQVAQGIEFFRASNSSVSVADALVVLEGVGGIMRTGRVEHYSRGVSTLFINN